MAKGEKTKEAQGKKITLKVAKKCVELKLDGKSRLNLSLKEVAKVPKCIQKLPQMDEMDLSRNLIRTFPNFTGRFIGICFLDLHSNYLEQLPGTIGLLQKLLALNLSNNRLTSIPAELGLLKKLHSLNLCINRLEGLPSSIGALKDLRHIGLSDNLFTRFPDCLSKLKLDRINLNRNPIYTKEAAAAVPESLTVTEGLYLVKDSVLCEGCQTKCRTEKKKVDEVTIPDVMTQREGDGEIGPSGGKSRRRKSGIGP